MRTADSTVNAASHHADGPRKRDVRRSRSASPSQPRTDVPGRHTRGVMRIRLLRVPGNPAYRGGIQPRRAGELFRDQAVTLPRRERATATAKAARRWQSTSSFPTYCKFPVRTLERPRLRTARPAPKPLATRSLPWWRVVDATELRYVQAHGDYGSNPSRSGKYFALTIRGAQAFASAPMNAGSTITATGLPQSVVNGGFIVNDPGPYGAGSSVFFEELQLAMVYGTMRPPVILSKPGP
jgi:hypothetical protein